MASNDTPATKGDLQALEGRLKSDMQELEGRVKSEMQEVEGRLNGRHDMLRSEMNHRFDELMELFRDSQTELLKAFYGYTESTNLRLKGVDSSAVELKERLSVVERRLTELERKVNFPGFPTQ